MEIISRRLTTCRWDRRPAAALVLAVASVVGCGAPTATVTGVVTYKGSRVTSGYVVFIDDTGRATLPASVGADGSFAIAKATVGRARVSFDNPPPTRPPCVEPGSPATDDPEHQQMVKALGRYVATPPRFKDPNTSGIGFELRPGPNRCDIVLE